MTDMSEIGQKVTDGRTWNGKGACLRAAETGAETVSGGTGDVVAGRM